MATLVLGAVGSVFGPLGSAIGSLIGSTIDGKIFGTGTAEGPRLKELAVSGSSYGSPIARQYGAMRSAGTIIWSTDLIERQNREGGGKGQPSTTHYSYSVSLAVALSSRPIDRIGRIWADGNLLRGAAGDLKTGGELRLYRGHADQPRDPLLAAELGNRCPAFRGTAYAVFEQLDLTDFGNRIPALSFEVFAGEGARFVNLMVQEAIGTIDVDAPFPELKGFSYDGGAVRDVVSLVDHLRPVCPTLDGEKFVLRDRLADLTMTPILPPAAQWDEGDFGSQSGSAGVRASVADGGFSSLRYYDVARDYQPGLQKANGYDERQRVFDFPGAFAASDALALTRSAQQRGRMRGETLQWRCAGLDPDITPGALVRVPEQPGIWRVTAWEWCEKGIERELVRHHMSSPRKISAAAGASWSPPDRAAAEIALRIFETPWDGTGYSDDRRLFAAVSTGEGRWAGATLHAVQNGVLVDIEQSVHRRATVGELSQPLAASNAIRLEADASIEVRLPGSNLQLERTNAAGIAQGRNRILIGSEVVQFLRADPIGADIWRLTGLLRGRGGTEPFATDHQAGTIAVLLDSDIAELPRAAAAMATTEGFVALGASGQSAQAATIDNTGLSLMPPAPVHAHASFDAAGNLALSWVRRARGGWHWRDGVGQVLVEEAEQYEVGSGPIDAPVFLKRTQTPKTTITPDEFAAFGALAQARFWVRQLGTFSHSLATQIAGPVQTTQSTRKTDGRAKRI